MPRDRTFHIVIAADVLALILPTRALGPKLELGLILVLLLATGWIWLRLNSEKEKR